MKEILITLIILICGCSLSDTSGPNTFSYTEDTYVVGIINKETTKYLCEKTTIGAVVIVNSDGGLIREAHASGLCIKDKSIKLVVVKALSAAPLLIMLGAEQSVCLYKNSFIGWHTPYRSRAHRAYTLDSRKGILQIVEPLKTAGYSKNITDRIAGRMILSSPYKITRQLAEDFKEELGHRFAGYCKY